MTHVYGATLRGTAEYVENMLEKEILPSMQETWLDEFKSFEHSVYISKKLFAGIAAAVPAASAAMRWLRNAATQQPAGQRMQWSTPTGFKVQHDYQDYTDSQVRLNSCGVVVTWVREWSSGTRAHAMRNAIAPNFVHAMDASHLCMVSNSMGTHSLSMVAIHDSFGTHACSVDSMHRIIREEFIRLYSQSNIMQSFTQEVEGVGEPPIRGSLDLSEVLNSEFMFS